MGMIFVLPATAMLRQPPQSATLFAARSATEDDADPDDEGKRWRDRIYEISPRSAPSQCRASLPPRSWSGPRCLNLLVCGSGRLAGSSRVDARIRSNLWRRVRGGRGHGPTTSTSCHMAPRRRRGSTGSAHPGPVPGEVAGPTRPCLGPGNRPHGDRPR